MMEVNINRTPLKARHVSFDKKSKTLKVELTNDVVFLVPTRVIQIFDSANLEEIKNVELLLDGLYLHWPCLDEDLKVQSLVEGIFGMAQWMESLKNRRDRAI